MLKGLESVNSFMNAEVKETEYGRNKIAISLKWNLTCKNWLDIECHKIGNILLEKNP